MPGDNAEFVRAMYADFAEEGWDGVLAHLPEDFEWVVDPRHPKAGSYRGLENYRAFLQELEEPFEQTRLKVDDTLEAGDCVVALLTVTRRPRGSSAEMTIHVATAWTFRDGTPVRGRFFADRREALQATGLR
jgi:ketosteroid isomerase-like protein